MIEGWLRFIIGFLFKDSKSSHAMRAQDVRGVRQRTPPLAKNQSMPDLHKSRHETEAPDMISPT